MNTQTSHIEQYKYPYNTNVNNESHQKGSEEEPNQNKDPMVTGIASRKAGKNLREKEKEEISKELCPCCNKYVETGVECGQCGNWFHYKCEGTTEEQVKNHYAKHMQYISEKD